MSFEIDVRKRLGEAEVALTLAAGDGATVLFGPSGVGKTSVLNMVAGLLRPDSGRILVDGETQTLPLAIYSALQQPGAEMLVWRLSAISVALSLIALVASELLTRRAGRGLHVL